MKKLIILVLGISISLCVMRFSYADEPRYSTAEEALQEANDYLNKNVKVSNYYSDKNIAGKAINKNNAIYGTRAFRNMPIFTYGTDIEASERAIRNAAIQVKIRDGEYRCLGYTLEHSLFANPDFPPDYPGEGIASKNGRWVKEPWLSNNEYIKDWLEGYERVFQPRNLDSRGLPSDFFASTIVDGPKPEHFASGGSVEDYVFILQPPTMYTAGLGIAFYTFNNGFNLRYNTFVLEPFALSANDLTASFENIPQSASAGDEVQVSVRINSTFEDAQDTEYSWIIRDGNGNILSNVVYSGHGTQDKGNITVPGKGERVLRSKFTMPASNVRVGFRVNNLAGDKPTEKSLDNNYVEAIVNTMRRVEVQASPYDLPYDVLGREIKHNLLNGASVSASVSLPDGWWTSSLTGMLNVSKNDSSNVLSNFSVENNPSVNEYSSSVSRYPVIKGRVLRTSFGDNPMSRQYLNTGAAGQSIDRTMQATFNGNVRRSYAYNCSVEDCEYCPHSSTVSGSFPSGAETLTFKTYVYNGRQNMPAVASRRFKETVELNTLSSLQRKLFWISDPYPFDVIRWMHYLDEGGNPYGYTQVPGQYQRIFTQQNTGDIDVSVNQSMANLYLRDRNAAKSGRYQSSYERAVFATDKELQYHAYPIKSGYYFNPAGEYQVKVKTVLFKDTNGRTDEHRNLVKEITEAFHYSSDLNYTLDGRNVFQIDIKKDTRINNTLMLDIQERHSIDTEELNYSNARDGDSHRFFKEILEGYSQSETLNSYNNYLYREYIKSGKIYKVTEETIITFRVNPSNMKLYTHVNLPNGNYTVGAWFDRINLDRYGYRNMQIEGISKETLDTITLRVTGSMYDDLNN